jgi:hypothetical protein
MVDDQAPSPRPLPQIGGEGKGECVCIKIKFLEKAMFDEIREIRKTRKKYN